MTRKAALYLFILFFHMSSAIAQVTFKPSLKQISADEIAITFSGTISGGWHVYAPDEKNGPIPATFNVEKIEGLKVSGGLKADKAPVRKYEEMFGATVSYYENAVTFTQKLKIIAKNYKIQGYLEYGACSDQSCTPPTSVDFSFLGTVKETAAKETEKAAGDEAAVAEPSVEETALATDTATTDTATVAAMSAEGLWTPVVKELAAFKDGDVTGGAGESSLLTIFILGALGGFIALLTPCVWPIIPMTVSFFLKRAKDDKRKGIRDAFTYGLSIIVIYLVLGLAVTLLFGASALNALSTNAVFNIFFFLLLVVFGASFLGGFEIVLPSSWTNAVDSKASSTTGLLSIFLMAFTLALVSFSCTGPIIGFLLVEMGTSGNITGPAVGMLGFAIALALPFTLFAIFPTWLKSAPKSGNWMNNVKVTLGFIELAFSLKFLSVADLAYGWHILDREVFLALWIVLFFLLGCYLIGWIRFPHDEDEWDEMGEKIINRRTPVTRFFMALCSFAFAVYMIPGLWGAPCKAVSAFAPPVSTQDFNLAASETIEAQYKDYEAGMEEARRQGKPVMIDFTGFGCVNCRKMEAAVWTDEGVKSMITDDYVLIQLFVDDKTPLPEPVEVVENGTPRKLRTVGDKWSYFQRTKFGSNTQPFYVLLDNDGKPLNAAYSYDEDIQRYKDFLSAGLRNYKR
ncbi:MAG: thioredoxin family protein [Prevotella sp.]|nr:thioredoxin family protein [Prevotella sp.]